MITCLHKFQKKLYFILELFKNVSKYIKTYLIISYHLYDYIFKYQK